MPPSLGGKSFVTSSDGTANPTRELAHGRADRAAQHGEPAERARSRRSRTRPGRRRTATTAPQMNAPSPCDSRRTTRTCRRPTRARRRSRRRARAAAAPGYISDMPAANTIVPTTRPRRVGHAAISADPGRREQPSASVPVAAAAEAVGQPRAEDAHDEDQHAVEQRRSRPALTCSSSTYSGTNAVKPASGIRPRNSTVPGPSADAVQQVLRPLRRRRSRRPRP